MSEANHNGGAMTAQLHEAIKAAKEEGMFQGRILQGIEDIKNSMKKIEEANIALSVKIESKADKTAFEEQAKEIKGLSRLVYIGFGIVSAVEFFIIVLK